MNKIWELQFFYNYYEKIADKYGIKVGNVI